MIIVDYMLPWVHAFSFNRWTIMCFGWLTISVYVVESLVIGMWHRPLGPKKIGDTALFEINLHSYVYITSCLPIILQINNLIWFDIKCILLFRTKGTSLHNVLNSILTLLLFYSLWWPLSYMLVGNRYFWLGLPFFILH